MSIPVRLEDGSMKYVVRHDVDGNGMDDHVIFDVEEYAKSYESCYVRNNLNACTDLSDPIRIRVQLFTASGTPAKLCDGRRTSSLLELKLRIGELGNNLADVSDLSLRSMAEDLFNVIRNRPDENKLVELAVKYINILNDVSKEGKMNSRQIDLIARLLVNHAGNIKGLFSGSVDLFSGDISRSLLNMVSKKFETCAEGSFWVSEINCLDDLIELSESELQEVIREFSSLSGCTVNSGRELTDDRVIGGILCMKGSYVERNENGSLHIATLGEDHEMDGRIFKKGTQLYFDEYGILDTEKIPEDAEQNDVGTSDFWQ